MQNLLVEECYFNLSFEVKTRLVCFNMISSCLRFVLAHLHLKPQKGLAILSLDFEEVVVYIPKNVETMPSKSLEYSMC